MNDNSVLYICKLLIRENSHSLRKNSCKVDHRGETCTKKIDSESENADAV